MLKASATRPDGRRLVILGLSRENCRRLLEEKPILFGLEEVVATSPPITIAIVGGETEDVIAETLRDGLLLGKVIAC